MPITNDLIDKMEDLDEKMYEAASKARHKPPPEAETENAAQKPKTTKTLEEELKNVMSSSCCIIAISLHHWQMEARRIHEPTHKDVDSGKRSRSHSYPSSSQPKRVTGCFLPVTQGMMSLVSAMYFDSLLSYTVSYLPLSRLQEKLLRGTPLWR